MKSLHGFLVTSLFAISFLVSLIENAPVANSQSFNAAEEDIKQLIVMIDAKLGRESVIGSGVIVGVGANSLYMITADHVVRRGEQEAEEIQVKFRWRPNRQFKAKLLRHRDRELDLAILTVPGLEDLGANLDAMPFDRVGNLGSLKRGDAIYLLGHPGGRPWRVNTTPERLAQTNANTLEFESNLIAPGHSGGALLSEQRDLIGMLRSDNAPYGEAISITKVIERLNEWEYPVDLDRRNIPTSFSTVSVGMDRACAITGSGIAYCWGQIGTYYERGYYRDSISRFGLKRFAPSPTRTKGGLTFRAISVGSVHACAITMEYKAYCWGSNRNFQLGNGTTLDSEDPMPVAHNLSFQTISAGRTVTCGVTTDAGVYCWGTIDRTVSTSPPPPCSHGMPCYPEPVRMAGGLLFRKVAVHQSYAGDDKILGITEEGILYELSYSFPDSPRAISSNIIFGDLSGRCALDSTGVAYCVELYVSVKDATRLSDFARVKIPDDIPLKRLYGGRASPCGVAVTDIVYCWPTLDKNETVGTVLTVPEGLRFESVAVSVKFWTNQPGERELLCAISANSALYCSASIQAYDDVGKDIHYGATFVPIPTSQYLASFRAISKHRRERDFMRAETEANAALKRYPEERLIKMQHALVQADVGQVDQAVEEMRGLLNGENDFDVYLDVADIYKRARNSSEMDQALQQADKLAKSKEDKEKVAFKRASMYQLDSKYDMAEAEYRQILKASPENARALNRLGFMLGQRNVKMDEAHQLINHALKIDPNNGPYLDSLGFVYDRMGKLDEAETAFRRAWETSAPDPAITERLADVIHKKGKIKEAITRWQDALQEWETSAPIDIDPAQVARIRKKLEGAGSNLGK